MVLVLTEASQFTNRSRVVVERSRTALLLREASASSARRCCSRAALPLPKLHSGVTFDVLCHRFYPGDEKTSSQSQEDGTRCEPHPFHRSCL